MYPAGKECWKVQKRFRYFNETLVFWTIHETDFIVKTVQSVWVILYCSSTTVGILGQDIDVITENFKTV